MTNPFAIVTLHAVNSYHKAIVEFSSSQQSIIPKILIYATGTTLIATIIYKTMNKNLPFKNLFRKIWSPIITETKTPPLPFELKYFDEYNEWAKSTDTHDETSEEHKKECLENMYYSTVRETIDDFYGDVIMCYDHKTLSFAYYARTGNIPYKYLETISRKYMIETNAPREIHVDIKSEYQKAVTAANTAATANTANTATTTANTATTATTTTTEPEDSNVFVKLKSYNNATNLKMHTNTNDKTTDKNDGFVTPDSKTTAPSNKILRENANRYSYRGKIDDFAEHHASFLAERRRTAATAASAQTDAPTVGGYAEFKKQRSAL
jgi:hypothetical protein